MSNEPQVSVVMSVFNNVDTVAESVESILRQSGVALELIAVDDGATDGSGGVLDYIAERDARVQVLHQSNLGLTRALINGCSLARGKFIARQDADDISLPGRLAAQTRVLEEQPSVDLVGCGTRFATSAGDILYTFFPDASQAMRKVRDLNPEHLDIVAGHGSAMFRRSAYENSGGYRAQFYFAQDRDLWVRLIENAEFCVVPEVLYEVRFDARAISALHRAEQIELAKLSFDSAKARRAGRSDAEILRIAEGVRKKPRGTIIRLRESNGLYFFGSCLRMQGNPRSKYYFLQAVKKYPLNVKAWFGLLRVIAGQ